MNQKELTREEYFCIMWENSYREETIQKVLKLSTKEYSSMKNQYTHFYM
jgi:hypothetical protein